MEMHNEASLPSGLNSEKAMYLHVHDLPGFYPSVEPRLEAGPLSDQTSPTPPETGTLAVLDESPASEVTRPLTV